MEIDDYLKYWKVIRYFVKAKYKITQAELDVLLFLRTEKYFSKDRFDDYNELMSWNIKRFDKLKCDGWIEVFRKRHGKTKALYQLSYKSQRMLTSIYEKLKGEPMPTSPSKNSMFQKNVSYSDKTHRNMIKEMNAFIKQQRHHAPE
tara:strand:- start:78 stop:515 length:438 start_codon:yes stop_codon:yes gene_type:complete